MNTEANQVIVDTRTKKEFRKERIKGAILAGSVEELNSLMDSLDHDQSLLVYCSDDYRSRDACSILANKGFERVYDMAGGLIEWKAQGFPYETKRHRRNLFSR